MCFGGAESGNDEPQSGQFLRTQSAEVDAAVAVDVAAKMKMRIKSRICMG